MQPQIKKRQLSGYLLIFVAAPTLTYVIGSWLDGLFGLPVFPVFPFNLFIGISVMILGLNLGIKSTRQLYQHGRGLPWGEAAHEVETQRLVTTGIYAYSRNPMVLGYSLLPVGMGLMFQSIGMVIALTPAVLLLNYLIVKRREEPRLLERFGEEYARYKAETPFMFPDWNKLTGEYLIPYIKTHSNQLSYVFLAELSLFITTLVIFDGLSVTNLVFMDLIPDIIFAVICVLGIIAGVAPKFYTFSLRGERHGSGVAGHHPDCGRFKGHTVSLGGRAYCAGCSGLVVGAILALIGLVSGLYPFDLEIGFWFGAMLVFLGLAQHFIDLGSGWAHLWLNLGFVVGDWLMYEAIQSMNLGFIASVYFLAVTVWWIYARIRASQWTHVSVCNECSEGCMLRFE